MATCVGICANDVDLPSALERALRSEGFVVRVAMSGTEALRDFPSDPPDVLVVDVALTDADGRDICEALRARGVASPVIYLTVRDALTDRLSGFARGADDFVTKPFAVAELVARIRVAARRDRRTLAPPALAVDPVSHGVRNGDRSEHLTPTEFRLLAALVAHAGEVLRRDQLRAVGWAHGAIVHDNTLDAYIARLRRKLTDVGCPDRLQTLRGVGYVLR